MLNPNIRTLQKVLDQYDRKGADRKGADRKEAVLEIEVRFGTFKINKTTFNNDVLFSHFNRLLETLKTDINEEDQYFSTTTVGVSGEIRKIESDNSIIWQKKSQVLRNIDLYEYDLRISMKTEKEIDEPKSFVPTLTRFRKRYSFLINNGTSRVDLTEVTVELKTHYEVEVEYIKGTLELFNDSVEYIFKLLKGTNIIYTNTDKSKLNKEIGQILSNNQREIFIKKNVLVNARNIKRADLKYGGIVGSQFGSYNVTYKADGLRKMLIIHTTGIWLVYPTGEYNLVVGPKQLQMKLYNALSGTVFDGELVKVNNSPSKYYFYIFDCLSFKSPATNNDCGITIQDEDYRIRKQFITLIVKFLRNDYIVVDVKETIEFDTPDTFFNAVGKLLNNEKSLNYKTDGLIFTPAQQKYNPHSDKYHLHSRILNKFPDVLKWKPPGEMTIDFSIKKLSNGTIDLLVYDRISGKEVPFRGDDINHLDKTMIDHQNQLIKDVESGTIVEFEWDGSRLIPRKIRLFKGSANTKEVALDNWHNIFHPITKDDLLDKSFKAVFKYHNQIKRQLFKEIRNKKSLLDLGSGRGGDVVSWAGISKNIKVVAVEPNADNRKELQLRVNNSKIKGNVRIVDSKGEDSDSIRTAVIRHIPGEKVEAISIMLSLSFFWESDEHLDSLIKTIVNNIKSGGSIIFLTIDGDTEEELLEPALLTKSKWTDHININGVKIKLYPKTEPPLGRPSDFIIPGENIVGNQKEYIVRLSDLTIRLEKYGFKLISLHRASSDSFMVPENNLLSSLYSYGHFKHDGYTKLSEQDEELINYEEQDEELINYEEQDEELINYEELHWLPVFHVDSSSGSISTGAANGDDVVEKLKYEWCHDNNLVRIATIGDGCCFFHAILKAFYAPYQENSNAKYRIELVSQLRKDLASNLSKENPKVRGFSYYETAGNGAITSLAIQEFINEDLIEMFNGIDFSLLGLQSLLNSHNTIGDELYSYIAEILNINIYVLKATAQRLTPQLIARCYSKDCYSVVILGNGYHYELVGVETTRGIQTLFKSDSKLVQNLNDIFGVNPPSNDVRSFDIIETFRETVNTIINDPSNSLTIASLQNKLVNRLSNTDPLVDLYLKSFDK